MSALGYFVGGFLAAIALGGWRRRREQLRRDARDWLRFPEAYNGALERGGRRW